MGEVLGIEYVLNSTKGVPRLQVQMTNSHVLSI